MLFQNPVIIWPHAIQIINQISKHKINSDAGKFDELSFFDTFWYRNINLKILNSSIMLSKMYKWAVVSINWLIYQTKMQPSKYANCKNVQIYAKWKSRFWFGFIDLEMRAYWKKFNIMNPITDTKLTEKKLLYMLKQMLSLAV